MVCGTARSLSPGVAQPVQQRLLCGQSKTQTAESGYKLEVSVTTSNTDGQFVISVKDNGNGIPDSIKEKVMPFFTTKPTGEGTGLGLSLSYDIVVKGHRGSIDIDSVGNEGTTFNVRLPVT